MAVLFVTEQLVDNIITSAKINAGAVTASKADLTDTWDFSSGTLQTATQATGTTSTDVATCAFVVNEIAENQYGVGQGINVDGGTGNLYADIVGAATGLTFTDGTDNALIKINTGKGVAVDGVTHDLQIDFEVDGGLNFGSNDKLQLRLDGSTLSKSSSGVKVADGGINTTQLADDAVDATKLGITYEVEHFSTTVVTGTTFALATSIESGMEKAVAIYKNGQRLEYVASPSDKDQYEVSGSVVTMGGSHNAGLTLSVYYFQ